MSVLVDTNVLLRRIQPDHVHHALAIDSVARLIATGEQVYFTLQNISEFWNVMTRPIAVNGLGFSPAFALGEVGKIETTLMLLPDSPAAYERMETSRLHSCRQRRKGARRAVRGPDECAWHSPARNASSG